MDSLFKIKLHQHCIDIVEQQLKGIIDALKDAQDGANNETKSSAGDKHETGRAMAQLETEKLTVQLSEANKLKTLFQKIDNTQQSNTALTGSLIKTNKGLFYLTVGLGKVAIENEIVFVISTASPIGKLLLNKKEKETFSFNNINYVIEKIN